MSISTPNEKESEQNLSNNNPKAHTYLNTKQNHIYEIVLLTHLVAKNHLISTHFNSFRFKNTHYLNEWTQFSSHLRSLKEYDTIKSDFETKRKLLLKHLNIQENEIQSSLKSTYTKWSISNFVLALSIISILILRILLAPFWIDLIIAMIGIHSFITRLQLQKMSALLEEEVQNHDHDKQILTQIDTTRAPLLIDTKKQPNIPAKRCLDKLNRYISGITINTQLIDKLCQLRDNMSHLVYPAEETALAVYLVTLNRIKEDEEEKKQRLPTERLKGRIIWTTGILGFIVCISCCTLTILILLGKWGNSTSTLYAGICGIIAFILFFLSFKLTESGDRKTYQAETELQIIDQHIEIIDDFISYGEEAPLNTN